VSTLQRILVALDGSPAAAAALVLALELRRRYGGRLILCTAVDREAAMAAAAQPDGLLLDAERIVDGFDTAARALLHAAAARANAAGAEVTTALLDGRSAVAIVDCARDSQADAIVMGTHGKHGLERLLLGSTAEGVLHMTPVPVFVVRVPDVEDDAAAAVPPARALDRLLVALDDSGPSDAALAFALDLAAPGKSRVLFCSVIETSDIFAKSLTYGYDPAPLLADLRGAAAGLLEAKVRAAAERGVPAESLIAEGNTADALLAAAAAHAADLIVVGTHGRRGLARFLLGSVAESVVRRSPLPVAVVRGR